MDHSTEFLPPTYELFYAPRQRAEHAAIASRRDGRAVHAEMWHSPEGPRLCVIAVDRPGFLALVTEALLAQGVAIRSARAFCQEAAEGRGEVVDLLELRTLSEPDAAAELDEVSLHEFVQHLSELLVDEPTEPPGSPSRENTTTPRTLRETTRVYFERGLTPRGRYLLVIEAPDSTVLLQAISRSLFEEHMRITACEIRTIRGRANNRLEVEPISGGELNDGALCDVQFAVLDAVLDALPALARASRPPPSQL